MPDSPHEHVTMLLNAAHAGDQHAADELLPLIYDELRRLAANQLASEAAGLTLQPTALVHEAYLRLVGANDSKWDGRGHFYGAAAIAMRRILVERARRYRAAKHGGKDNKPAAREALADVNLPTPTPGSEPVDLIALDAALSKLEHKDERQARIVMLRFFAGLTIEQAASVLGLSEATVKNEWIYARAWLRREIEGAPNASS